MKEFLHHLFIPRESNNHRSKLLHHQSLFFVIAFLFISGSFIHVFKNSYSSVLGAVTNISVEQLLLLTNQKREKDGMNDLALNNDLSKAAALKASDMFANNYWAHNAPDGKTPWYFIKQSGYVYVYAGENLARGFETSEEVVDAWMNSPTHRENLVSPYYKDIGFAIMEGKLLGENTTLVVQMFGNKSLVTTESKPAVSQMEQPQTQIAGKQVAPAFQVVNLPFVNSFSLSRNISLLIVSLFIFILAIDMTIIARKKVVRLVGHNMDHILFLGVIFGLILIFSKGIVL